MGQGEKEKSVPRPRALRVHVVFGEMQRVQGRCGRVWEMRWGPYLENLCVIIILCAASFLTVSIEGEGFLISL